MPSYASVAEFRAYAPSVIQSDEAIQAALDRASRDIDLFLAARLPYSLTAISPLRYDLTKFDAWTVTGIKNATCAQAEFRLAVGPDHFVQGAGTVVQGPDFTITTGGGSSSGGSGGLLGPMAVRELQGIGLVLHGARARP